MDQKRQTVGPNIYLVGFMGVGKSTVGKRVARILNYSFVDSDQMIEKLVGKTIPEVFADEGETAFRRYEREFIDSGHTAGGVVVSCGGGLVVQEGMLEKLKSKGVVICLFASVESIISRTQRSSHRPLLNVDDPEARIRELFVEREPIYMNSDVCISTEGRPVQEVVKHVLRAYKNTEHRTPNAEL